MTVVDVLTRRWLQVGDKFACAPAKCGGTALYCAALGLDPSWRSAAFWLTQQKAPLYTPDEVLESRARAFLAVRDPVDRFMSLWRDKCRVGDDNVARLRGLTPDELMDLIEAEPEGDQHWLPQVSYYRKGFSVVPFRYLHVHLGLPRVVVNRSETLENDTPPPAERIRRHYAADVDLCSR